MEGGNRIPRKGTEVEYQGKKYISIRELCRELDIPYSEMMHKFYRTQDVEESVAWARKAQEESRYYELWNKKYESLCDVHWPDKKERLTFSGVLVCAECGEIYSHIQPHNPRRKNSIPKWKCKNYVYQNRVACKGGFISDTEVEEVCIHAINGLIKNPSQMEKVKRKEQKVSAEYRRLDTRIAESQNRGADDGRVQPTPKRGMTLMP